MARGKRVQKADGPNTQVGVRLDADLLELIDAEVERLQAELPGMVVSRSDVVRNCVAKVLRPAAKSRGR
jgi:hypothetical protein